MITRLDAWIVSRHQRIADIAYTYWPTISHYLLASIMLRMGGVLLVLYCYAVWLSYVAIGSALINLTAEFHLFSRLMKAHRAWLRDGKAYALGDTVFARRWGLFFTTMFTLFLVIDAVFAEVKMSTATITAFFFFETSSMYFASCVPPTPIQRTQHKLAHQASS